VFAVTFKYKVVQEEVDNNKNIILYVDVCSMNCRKLLHACLMPSVL